MAPQRATDLSTAYRAADLQPLSGAMLDNYYTDLSAVRKSESTVNISTILDLQPAGEFSTILLTGHRGCGKSTELRRLERKWKEHYYIVYLETDRVTDINDIEYTDLYLLVAQYVEYELRKIHIQLDQKIIQDFGDWFAEITQETEQSVENSISLSGEITLGSDSPFPIPFIAKLLAMLTSQIKGGSSRKRSIRQTLEKDFSRLRTTLNLLLDDAHQKLRARKKDCKGLLLIFDNLDRCPPHVAEKLFFDYGMQIQDLNCTIIFTVPISALYSPRGLSNNLPEPKIVPMISIYHFDRDHNPLDFDPAGIASLIRLLDQRMDTSHIFASPQGLEELVKASGGHIRHLMQMVREACLTAIGRKHAAIESEDILYAIKQRQFDFERIIPDQHYAAIAETYREKRTANDVIGQATLFNTSVLEYNGDQRWNYPHPCVMRIHAFQQYLNP